MTNLDNSVKIRASWKNPVKNSISNQRTTLFYKGSKKIFYNKDLIFDERYYKGTILQWTCKSN